MRRSAQPLNLNARAHRVSSTCLDLECSTWRGSVISVWRPLFSAEHRCSMAARVLATMAAGLPNFVSLFLVAYPVWRRYRWSYLVVPLTIDRMEYFAEKEEWFNALSTPYDAHPSDDIRQPTRQGVALLALHSMLACRDIPSSTQTVVNICVKHKRTGGTDDDRPTCAPPRPLTRSANCTCVQFPNAQLNRRLQPLYQD